MKNRKKQEILILLVDQQPLTCFNTVNLFTGVTVGRKFSRPERTRRIISAVSSAEDRRNVIKLAGFNFNAVRVRLADSKRNLGGGALVCGSACGICSFHL